MRRTALRRRPHRDPVNPEDRADVFDRDKGCVLASLEAGHECRDAFGNRHAPTDLWRLSCEHVKPELMMGKRAPSTPDSMVALCMAANLRPPTKAQRVLMREYLAGSCDEGRDGGVAVVERGSSKRTDDVSNAQTERPAGRVGACGGPA